MNFRVRWLYPTAFVCLLLSGVAGLVYQVVWARYLALFLGHTSYAVVAVLVAFMGGLALGNAWLGRYADRMERPLALYAWLEIGIAAYALAFPYYFELCRTAYVALGRGAVPGSPWLLASKFGFSFAAILIPTAMMGGTLPVLTRLVTRSLGELRARVAGLYFVNSAGAVIGVIVADFWWVPSWGLESTVMGGAALNAVVGGIALLANGMLEESRVEAGTGKGVPARPGSGTEGAPESGGDGEVYTASELRLAVIAAGVSGFVAMLYEVVWTRLLGLALGSSTHAFSIMLVTFITGIAAGAWWVGRWRGLRRTFDAFGWAELALGLTLLGSMFFYHLLPYGFVRLGSMVARSPGNHALYQGVQFLLCFSVMFVPALCLGMTLPLASRVATSELARTGRSVGLVFSVNTLGTVLGAALSGLVLLPALGLARSLALGVGLNLAIAVAVLLRRRTGAARGVAWASPGLALGLVVLAGGTLS
ncbi:MAG: fused MFS/spermidine synthase, partial [Verrucomicrobiales bacterium]|nr:fused MFS/spermidine synthase [Verrucomicrobiales bacterium]